MKRRVALVVRKSGVSEEESGVSGGEKSEVKGRVALATYRYEEKSGK